LRKHHLIIRVGAGLIQFVYGSHSRLAADLTLDKNLFSLPFSGAFMVDEANMHSISGVLLEFLSLRPLLEAFTHAQVCGLSCIPKNVRPRQRPEIHVLCNFL